ncbi:MAG: peptidylprolyl isomerase [Candidatus Caldatribacteriota bacterium]
MKKIFHRSNLTLTFFISLIILLLITSSFLSAQEQTTIQNTEQDKTETELPPETVIATFGEQAITLGEFNELWSQILEEYGPGLDKYSVLNQLILEKLLITEAKNSGLEGDEKVQKQIKEITEQILVQALIQKEILEKVEVSEEEITQYYEDNKENYIVKEQVHLYNILIDQEEKAKEIMERLKKGEDFEKIAQENSLSPSASKGGDMGYVLKGNLLPEIDEVIFALEINEVSEIVKTEAGFHILKITDKKPERLKDLEEVREEIFQSLLYTKQNEAFEKLTEELKSKANIVINEEAIK